VCGIAGFLDFRARDSRSDLERMVRCMADALAHRGPDDAGAWVDEAAGVALGHRRLSIVDLSPAGHQPMLSAGDRYVIVYNGEIYNHGELREELARRGAAFRGHSDTEVVLAAVDAWGPARALGRFNGMFAMALWDRRERCLHLARDRFGEKPLYYGVVGGTLFFGSELKALRAHPRCDMAVDRAALAQFLRFGYVPAPASIYAGIRKLRPGTHLRVAVEDHAAAHPTPYWSISGAVRAAVQDRFAGPEDAAIDELDRLLRDAIRLRMVADVPLGAFLSGGIDSSMVVALMQAESRAPVRTFTIGFHDRAYDEASAARAVAKHLGTDHTELYVTPEEARAVIPRLPALYDEPFADSSQIPTFLVAELARRHVTVALSGDGGDELFGGYNRYFWAQNVWNGVRTVPRRARPLARAAILGALAATARRAAVHPGPGHGRGGHDSRRSQRDGQSAWGARLPPFLRPRLPSRLLPRLPADKLQKLADLFAASDEHDVYLRLASTWKEPLAVVRGAEPGLEPLPVPALLSREAAELGVTSFAEQMMYADTLTYLPDDILAKVDRATMGVSLEGRMPFLDPRLLSFAWRLPPRAKLRAGTGKLPLRRLLARYVPEALFDRPKMGFGVPVGAWLRGPLRDWAESLLGEGALSRGGFFERGPVRAAWDEHLRGTRNLEHPLWAVLMFQAWQASQPGLQAPRTAGREPRIFRPSP